MSCQPKAPPTKATHYVKEKVNGGHMYVMSTSQIIQNVKMRFKNLSAGAKAEFNGIGMKNEIGGQRRNGHLYSEDGVVWECHSTVGYLFSYDDCTNKSFGNKLQNIPVENMQPKEIILEPLSLPLVLSQTHKTTSQQIQQNAEKGIPKLTETLTKLEEFREMTKKSNIGLGEIDELKQEIKTLSNTILQDIETLYDHNSSTKEKSIASTRLSELDCEAAGLKLEKLREKITKIVLGNHIPEWLKGRSLNGSTEAAEYRVAIIGKTGSGKSSLANYIVGQKFFRVGDTGDRVTVKFDKKRVAIDNKKLNIYDTPGFYDKDGENKLAKNQLKLAQKDGEVKGFDAFIYVANYHGTRDARKVFDVIKKKHGDGIRHYTILVLTQVKGKVDDILKTEFAEISKEVGDRAIGVRCQDWSVLHPDERAETNRQLLQMIQHISHATDGKRYKKGIKKFWELWELF